MMKHFLTYSVKPIQNWKDKQTILKMAKVLKQIFPQRIYAEHN